MIAPLKPLRLISLSLPACAMLVFLGLVTSACGTIASNGPVELKTNFSSSASATNPVPAATNSAGAGTNSAAGTNFCAVELPIPAALFELASKPTKDPFFPLSLRQPIPVVTNSAPAFSASAFALKGLSGSTGHRLALINNRTLAAGEDNEVTAASGKVKIHCVEIRENSVIIQVDGQGEPFEVFLRKSAQ